MLRACGPLTVPVASGAHHVFVAMVLRVSVDLGILVFLVYLVPRVVVAPVAPNISAARTITIRMVIVGADSVPYLPPLWADTSTKFVGKLSTIL